MTKLGSQRQELRALCASGCVAHAVDLAFERFNDFGRDGDVLDLLRSAVERAAVLMEQVSAGPAPSAKSG